jgi:hypothetical protein
MSASLVVRSLRFSVLQFELAALAEHICFIYNLDLSHD